MPPLPDLLSDNLLPPSPPTAPFVPRTTTKIPGKKVKTRRKNEATPVSTVGQWQKPEAKGAARGIAPPDLSPPSSPPSPDFFPTRPPEPTDAHDSPVLAALGDGLLDQTGGWGADEWAHDDTDDGIPTREDEKLDHAIQEPLPPSRPPATRAAAAPASAPASAPTVPSRSEGLKGGFNTNSPTTSPRPGYRVPSRPVPAPTTLPYAPASPRGRPVSMPAPYPEPTMLPQRRRQELTSRERNGAVQARSTSRQMPVSEFLAYDVLPTSSDGASTTGDLILLASKGNSLHLHKVDREGTRRHGHLEGLRGRIVSAKILSTGARYDPMCHQRPLVALVIHGPMATSSGSSESQDSDFDPSGFQDMHRTQEDDRTDKYQTTVEVYSLKDREHIATLYRSPLLEVDASSNDIYGEPPGPFGALNIQSKGRFIILSSGVSGEVYIFDTPTDATDRSFRCIGKTWTTTQGKKSRTWSTSASAQEQEAAREAAAKLAIRPDVALVSMSNRWLAVVPPVASSKTSLHGSVDGFLTSRTTPGLRSHAPGSQPQTTCELDTPFEDSRLQKAARDVTQEMLKGARWVGDQGMQAWKSYWNKSENQNTHEPDTMAIPQQQFPPTHANDAIVNTSRHPTLVSIVDLEKLSESQGAKAESSLQPTATFSLSDGCSFLSFNPSGLGLLTANTKGDVCYVWDLMRMVYGKSMAPTDAADASKPFVRQIARFSRVTIANIVDVVWNEPKGERLAIVTDRGTVHVHDMPQAAFQWPPAARAKRPSPPRKRSSDAASVPQASGLVGALNVVSGGAQPIFAAVRGSALPGWGGFALPAAGAGAGVKGGRMVSTGLSKSMGAATGTVDSILRMGDARIHLPGSARVTSVGSTRWLQTKDTTSLAVLGGGTLRIYSVLSNTDVRGKKRHSVVGLQLAEFAAPKTGDSSHPPPIEGTALDGYWPDTQTTQPRVPRSSAQPISYAELETSAPYQPFHTDRRVNFSVFEASTNHHLDGLEAWVFGDEITTSQVVGSSDESDDTQLGPEACAAMEEMAEASEEMQPEQAVVTTTRRKKGKKTASRHKIDDENFDNSVMIDFAQDRV